MDDFVVASYKAAVEQMVEGELQDHLGYAKHGQRLEATSNYRNGRSTKAVRTPKGSLVLELPRDCGGSFESRLVLKRKRTIEVVEETIVSLYPKGMTTRDVAEQISRITDRILDTVHAWQSVRWNRGT